MARRKRIEEQRPRREFRRGFFYLLIDILSRVCYYKAHKRGGKIMETEKRKTTTSSEVKRRYNQKTYGAVTAYVPKEMAEAFKAKCAAEGIPQAQIIKRAIEAFLNE